jgi:hypothetical protein
MIIYAVMKNTQANDSDCWAYWVEEEQLRLFSNSISANNFIKDELARLSQKEKNEIKANLIWENKAYFSVDRNGKNPILWELLFVKEIEIYD